MNNSFVNNHPEVVLPHTCLLGEGPVWDANRKIISWIDILNGIIHEFDTKKQSHRMIELGSIVGAVALTKKGNYLAALKSGLSYVDRTTGKIQFLQRPEQDLMDNRFNDGKCDPFGRFWVGTMSMSEDQGAGHVYMFDDQITCSKKIESVTISNGLAWSPDHQIFYYIDTPTFQVVAYDYEVSTGNITNKRTVIQIPNNEGYPDGMTIDTEGMLWIAHWDGAQVARWDPSTGIKILSIALPVDRVTSCTFGGDDLTDLYITTAKVGLTEQQLIEQPLAGSLFVVRDSGFQGIPTVEFDDFSLKIV
jgi:sugar lactone lactonase YvrE